MRTESRTDVERVAWLLGDPVGVETDEFLENLDQRVSVEGLSHPTETRNPSQSWRLKATSTPRRTGRAIRDALVFIRLMFMSGRNSVTRPLGVRYAFMPSNSVCA